MKKNNSRLYITVIIFVSLCLALLTTVILLKKVPKKEISIPSVSKSLSKVSGGRLWIKLQDDDSLYKSKDVVNGFIIADSNNQPIANFEIVLTYDPTIVQLITIENLEPDFQTVKQLNKERAVLTGTKKLTVNTPLIFKETSLVMFRFKAVKSGNSYLRLLFSPYKKISSHLFNEQTKEILNQVKEAIVFIGQPVTVAKNQTVHLFNTNLILKLQSIEKPSATCRDCLTLVTLKVENNGKTKDLVFKSGGIAGVLVNQINAFGYTFKLDSLGENEVNLIYYKI